MLNITIIQIKLKVDVIPINFIQCSCFPFGKTFVKMSITISWVLQYSSFIPFACIWCMMKWTCMSMFLFRKWKLGFSMNTIVLWLFEWITTTFFCFWPKLTSNCFPHIVYIEAWNKAMYFDFMLDKAIFFVCYWSNLQFH